MEFCLQTLSIQNLSVNTFGSWPHCEFSSVQSHFFSFFCFLLYNPKILTSPPALGSKSLIRILPLARRNPWEYIHSGRVAHPAVLPKVHHCPEMFYVPTEVNTAQVDGLPQLTSLDSHKHYTSCILRVSHRTFVPSSPTSDPPKH